MYKLTIVTKYNTIEFAVDDYNSPEVQEILEQPYIVSVRMTRIDDKTKVRRLIKNEYNTQHSSNNYYNDDEQ